MKLTRQAQGGGFFQKLSADQEIRGLLLADLDGLAGRGYCSRQVTVLPQSLSQDSAQGGVGIHHQNPAGLRTIVRRR
jgi:hypothetical protein